MANGTTIASAYVQVLPTTKGIKGSLEGLLSGGGIGGGFGKAIMGAIGKVLTGAAVAKVFKTAIDEGAKLQQSMGGVETLFGAGGKSLEEYAASQGKSVDKVAAKYDMLMAAQSAVMANAGIAWKTSGLSANDYMETVTGFAAALKRSTKSEADAARVADMAVIDMADNANKMGTDMSSIQMAYQGFAKQNYTMLDNLKLGYGGTKSEMKRLLKDAGKLTGKKYNLNNLADVYEAIHVIQGELGITGTTAEEAEKTFTGSFAAMKAAAANLFGKMGLGEDIGPALADLSKSAGTFLFGNLVPMILNVFKSAFAGLPALIPALGDFIINGVKSLATYDWAGLGNTILTGITGVFGNTGDWLKKTILGENYTDESTWSDVGTTIWNGIKSGLTAAVTALGEAGAWVKKIILGDSYTDGASWESVGDAIWNGIGDGLKAAVAALGAAGTWVKQLILGESYTDGASWADVGSVIWDNIQSGLATALSAAGAAGTWLKKKLLGDSYTDGASWLDVGSVIWTNIKSGLSTAVGTVGTWLKQLVLGESYTDGASWLDVGSVIWTNIKSGLSTAVGTVGTWLKKLVLGESYTDGASWLDVGSVIWTNIKSGLSTAVGTVGTWLKQLILGESYTDGASWLDVGSVIWTNIKSGLSTAVGTVGTWLKQLVLGESYTDGASWLDVGSVIWTNIKSGISTAVGAVGTWLKQLLLGDSYSDGASWLDVGSTIWTNIKSGISTAIAAAGNWLSSLLGLSSWTDSEGGASGVGGKIAGGIAQGVRGMLNLAGTAASWLTGLLGLGSWKDDGSSTTIGSTIWTNIKTGLGDLLDGTGKFLSGGFTAAFNTISTIDWAGVGSTILGGIQGALDGIAAIAGGIWDGIKNFFGGGQEEDPAVDWSTNVEASMLEAEPILQGAAQGLGDAATRALNSQFSEDDGRTLFGNLVTGIRLAAMEADFTADIAGVTNQIRTLFETSQDWNSAGATVATGLKKGIESKKTDVGNAGKDLAKAAKDKFRAEIGWGGSKLNSLGKDVANGIAAGIKEGKGKMTDALMEAFDDAIDELKKLLEIGSPSRLFAREIGRFIPLGIASGISDYAYAMDDALSGPLDAMSRSALSYQPELAGAGGYGYQQNITINSPRALSPWEVARQTRNATRQMALAMRG